MDDAMASRPRAPLPRWTVPLVAALAVLAGAAVLLVLWRWIDSRALADAEKRTSAQIEAVKLASGIVVGGGGLFALYLAARRQRTQELELEVRRIELTQRDRVQIHAERVAEDSRLDAAERRVTELYTKAADQLGSDKAPVRLAGLYALERLGQGNPDHRHTIVDVICAYLRMPYASLDEQADADELIKRQRHEELQVRTAAQRILANHLRDDPSANSPESSNSLTSFWSNVHLDLSGAHLVHFTLAQANLLSINLNNATLAGETVFRGMQCESAFVQNTNFLGHTDFRGTQFTNSAWISSSIFADGVWFHGDKFYRPARFGRHVSFQGSTFNGKTRFEGVVFSGSADFRNATWPDGSTSVEFRDTVIEHPEATNPEAGANSNCWPDGWHLDATGAYATLKRS
ncbi:pentapeptide repeat-containing protein [Lentzea sp. NPDC003310]|uniref:pentapeptide repeat-containing protein n=1 Tax=Lentzea sp. NPDC003310 TaxID=3154447 RepID=UPI0033A429D4